MPKFSIIIPVYNVAPYLRECLDSVLAQTYADWEAICVDDGSTDGSGAILDEYAAKDERFRVIHQKNAGVSAARNAALDVARGEWVCFADADDRIGNDYLSSFATFPDKADVNYFNIKATDVGGREYVTKLPFVRRLEIGEAIVRIGYSMVFEQEIDTFGIAWGKIIRGSLAKRVRFDVTLSSYEDLLYTLDVCNLAKTFSSFTEVVYFYRISPMSLSHRRLTEGERRMRHERLAEAFLTMGKHLSLSCLKKIAFARFIGFHCHAKLGWKSWKDALALSNQMCDISSYVAPESSGRIGKLLRRIIKHPFFVAAVLWIYANLFNRYVVNFVPVR